MNLTFTHIYLDSPFNRGLQKSIGRVGLQDNSSKADIEMGTANGRHSISLLAAYFKTLHIIATLVRHFLIFRNQNGSYPESVIYALKAAPRKVFRTDVHVL